MVVRYVGSGHRTAVRIRQDDLSNELLDRPAAFDEAARQVVEELGVRRGIARRSEVVHGPDESGAEEPVPDAIHEDARRERIRTEP